MRLLLADDNEMNVELFTAALGDYDVVVARDGRQALDRALAQRFDLILLDIQMPGLDGYDVCRALRAKGLKTPIVALTASAMPSDVTKGHAAGFDAYLTKPISPHDLLSAVRSHTRSAA
jgi:CheY-like chemotaxis protein